MGTQSPDLMLGNILHQLEKETQNLSWFFLNSEPYILGFQSTHNSDLFNENMDDQIYKLIFSFNFHKIHPVHIYFLLLEYLLHHASPYCFLIPSFGVFCMCIFELFADSKTLLSWKMNKRYFILSNHGPETRSYITSNFMFKHRSKIMKFL